MSGPFKYYVNLRLIPKLFQKVSKVQTTLVKYISEYEEVNLSKTEATRPKQKDAKFFDNHPIPIILVFIRKLSLSTLR